MLDNLIALTLLQVILQLHTPNKSHFISHIKITPRKKKMNHTLMRIVLWLVSFSWVICHELIVNISYRLEAGLNSVDSCFFYVVIGAMSASIRFQGRLFVIVWNYRRASRRWCMWCAGPACYYCYAFNYGLEISREALIYRKNTKGEIVE